MAQTRTLQRRIRSVKNARQITKALEVVAAARMRRVVALVEGSRNYGELAAATMRRISRNPEVKSHPLFSADGDKPPLFIIFTSDRGQAGAFNSHIFHLALSAFENAKQRPQVVVFGRKGARFFSRSNAIDLRGVYENVEDVPEANVFGALLRTVEEGLASGALGQISIVYTQFISSLNQKATLFKLAPVDISVEVSAEKLVYEFEPDSNEVLDEAIKLYLEAKLMQARIESAASEHAMRMIAMGNAHRNASDLIDDLTLELNATRQAAITQEIAEITGGAAAIAA